MKKIFLYLAALTAVAVACRKVEIEPQEEIVPEPEVEMITETITGSRDVSTKVTIDNTSGAFAWTATNDLVAVHLNNGTYVISAGASVSAKSATFDVTYPAGATRDAFAVYPSSIVAADAANYGQTGHTLDVTLPSSYTLAQVSGETSPCPMIATNDPSSSEWSFKQLCGLLRLTLNDIPPSTKRLEIDFDGKKVCGDFSIASPDPGTSGLATTADGSHDKITITKDETDVVLGETSLVLNIPLPVGYYPSITVVAYSTLSGGTPSLVGSVSFGYTAKLAKATKRTASLNLHVFSINDSRYAIFAPGNLQYLGNGDGTGSWRFAEHQYDFMGDGPSSGTDFQGNVTVEGYTKYNASADLDVARDLFGWGTSGYNGKYPYLTSQNGNDYFDGSLVGDDANYDWGVYHSASGSSTDKITNGGYFSWRLLTSAEWEYLMARESSDYDDYRYCLATLTGITTNDIYGMILFPDDWTNNPSINEYGDSDYDTNVFDADQWAILEALGCVFLPAAHVRDGHSFDDYYLNQGYYWSSTVVWFSNAYRGKGIYFEDGWTVFNEEYLRKLGHSVRLIRDL